MSGSPMLGNAGVASEKPSGGSEAPGIGGSRSGIGGRLGKPGSTGDGTASENPMGGNEAPGIGGSLSGIGGSEGNPIAGKAGVARLKPGSAKSQRDTAQVQGTGGPPTDGVAVPDRIQESIRVVMLAAADAWSGANAANMVANPTGRGGGAPTNVGAMPAATEAAKAAKADSIPGAAAGEAKAPASAEASAVCAAATERLGGTTAVA